MITAIIITKNEEQFIENCLKSLSWVDEIIVVDNGSKDDTLKIASKYTDKILTSEEADLSQLRNMAATSSTSDWILYVDADERVLLPLREEIEFIVQDTAGSSAYAISRRNIIFGHEEKYGPFWPDWVIRLIKKSDFESWVGKVHEYPKFKGELGYLENSLLHLTHRNIDNIVLKSLNYSKIDAQLRFDAHHPRMVGWRFLRILFGEIFYQGIVRKGFFSGTVGVMDSLLQSFSLFMTYVRLWEMQQLKPLDEVYKDIDKTLVENDFRY